MTKSRSKPLTMDEWRNSPKSARKNPKLTPEQAQQITDEAIAHNHKWDVQEKSMLVAKTIFRQALKIYRIITIIKAKNNAIP